MTPAQRNPYKAYNQATHTVAKTRQVVMLYDGVIRNLSQAREAIKENKIEERYNKLVRSSEIINGLQMSLDFDSGEDVAQILYDFYASIDSRIIAMHRSPNTDVIDEMIAEIKEMRELWNRIDQGEVDATTGGLSEQPAEAPGSSPSPSSDSGASASTIGTESPAPAEPSNSGDEKPDSMVAFSA